MMTMTRREELSQIAREVAREQGVELYWLEYRAAPGRWQLVVMIDKEGGVTIDDCARVSRALEAPFDAVIDRGYDLEVSSPGIDRPLHTVEHLRRAIGERIRIKTYAPIEGRRVWHGTLFAVKNGTIALETPDGPLELPTSQLADARVSPEFS